MASRLVQPSMRDVIEARAYQHFSRREGMRHNRGRFRSGGGTGTVTPKAIFGADLLTWIRTDLGTTPGTCIDQSGNGVNFTQAVGAAQGTLAADATLGGMVTLLFDAVDDTLSATLNRPAPNVEATSIFSVIKQVTWASGRAVYGVASNTFGAFQIGTTPALVQRNITAANSSTGAPLDTWVRSLQIFSGSTADVNKLGSAAAVTGADSGATDPGATLSIGSRGTGNFWNGYIAEFFVVRGVASAGQQSAVDAYIAGWSGGLVTV